MLLLLLFEKVFDKLEIQKQKRQGTVMGKTFKKQAFKSTSVSATAIKKVISMPCF